LIKYLHNATRSWASSEQRLVNFGDGQLRVRWCPVILLELIWNEP